MSDAGRQECARCILRREDDPDIRFDPEGVCNHCRTYDALAKGSPAGGFAPVAERIRRAGRGRAYDSVVGVSGGVDSSYVAYLAKQHGLRPLAVHFDNGWDSELAVRNIELLVRQLGFDLHTHVVSWPEFRSLQVAYIKASVVDIEAITDHGIMACLYQAARQHGVRTILTGVNVATEGFLPARWVHHKNDLINLKAIHRAYGTVPLRTFPTLGLLRQLYYTRLRRIRLVNVLDYVPYVKEEAKRTLAAELGWRDYGGKHYESVFTRFYQAYILPRKFGIDKRRSHLSTLVCAGQLTREEALRQIAPDAYPAAELAQEKEFVVKKLGLTEAEFDELMSQPPRDHLEFASYLRLHRRLAPVVRAGRRLLARGAR
ncbi:MAG TPA: N-acetyl sugar amidotransferase [Vicinamibacteria bacterium]